MHVLQLCQRAHLRFCFSKKFHSTVYRNSLDNLDIAKIFWYFPASALLIQHQQCNYPSGLHTTMFTLVYYELYSKTNRRLQSNLQWKSPGSKKKNKTQVCWIRTTIPYSWLLLILSFCCLFFFFVCFLFTFGSVYAWIGIKQQNAVISLSTWVHTAQLLRVFTF